jgi:hypothetical protein
MMRGERMIKICTFSEVQFVRKMLEKKLKNITLIRKIGMRKTSFMVNAL